MNRSVNHTTPPAAARALHTLSPPSLLNPLPSSRQIHVTPPSSPTTPTFEDDHGVFTPTPCINRFPKRIILCRHGESKGNVSDVAYVTTPDWLIPLSATGLAQSTQLGSRLRNLLNGETCYFYTSPYLRTKQTLAKVLQGIGLERQVVGVREEPRLTEQQFGNFQVRERDGGREGEERTT